MKILQFLTSKAFFKQLLYIAIFLGVILFAVLMWLKFYTNHGQKLALPDYIGEQMNDAVTDAEDKTFQILVHDSIHIVGKPGGQILNQNPKPGSEVKEGRKIYVRTTKYNSDQYPLSKLPQLYGNDFDQKKRELKFQEINAVIKDYKYDPGEPNHILEVYYKGEKIVSGTVFKKSVMVEKGGTLEMILSSRGGGKTDLPDLKCYSYPEAVFYLEQLKLKVGNVNKIGTVTNLDSAYILFQNPAFDPIKTIERGTPVDISVQQSKPSQCN